MTSLPNLQGQRVILGLSGGVDSAVAAILLQQSGADVHALHMTNWEDDDGYCTAAEDLQDARGVCERIGIPLHHVNFAADYRERVFSYFLDEYKAGRTPNPDVLCNREIKFGAFRDYAKRLGGQGLATGHYAKVIDSDDRFELHKADDLNKDQSYFLHAVSASALAETVFPLGNLDKSAVRQIARDYGLRNYDKKDSTGICFIGERPFRQFLETYLPAQPGDIKTPDGRRVGEHRGLMYYTIGQRQGLGIGGLADAGDAPWYVAAKRLDDNALVVVQGEHSLLYADGLTASRIAWINGPPRQLATAGEMRLQAKIRYRQADQPCTVAAIDANTLQVTFDDPQRAVAPGQFVVFYDGTLCLGGATIDRPTTANSPLQAAI